MKRHGPRTRLMFAAAVMSMACGRGGEPRPAPSPSSKPLADALTDTALDTKVLGDANLTANEVVRNAGDCEAAKPIIAEANARLDAAEPKLRTAAGKASLDALRHQVAKVADLCP